MHFDAPVSKEVLQGALARSPFIDFLGLTVLKTDPEREEIHMRLEMRPEFERAPGSGQWHGGPLAAVIDTVGDYALMMLIGQALPTINFRVDYLRPAVKTALTAIARVRRNGKTVGVVDVDLINEAGQVVAIGRACYSTLSAAPR
jgi:uncharacterized protein (TIGR00369 family)